MFQEIVDRYRSGDPDLIQTSFGQGAPFADLLKGINHTGMCACLACYSYTKDESDIPAAVFAEDTGNDTNGDINTDGRVSPGGSVIDEIDTAGDSDWFRIDLLAGETYTFTVYLLSLSDSILTLRDSTGVTITDNDDANFGAGLLYSEITYTATESGTFFLDVGAFGTNTGSYVISSSRPVDDDIGGTAATAGSIEIEGDVAVSQLDETGDRDWYEVQLVAGERYVFRTANPDGNTNGIDTTLTLRDADGAVQAYNDDAGGGSLYSEIRFTATTSGTYYLDVAGWADGEQGAYQLSAGFREPLLELDNDGIAAQLLYGTGGDETNLRRWDVGEGDTITVDLTTLGADGQFLAREALALWTDVTGIIFEEVTGGAQITFQNTEDGAFARTSTVAGIITSVDVNVSTDWLANFGTTLDSYSFQTYIHEIGHALGLRHPGPYNGDGSYDDDAVFLNDSWATTVMSYFSQTENSFFEGLGFDRLFTLTPMSGDIVAAQISYGGSTGTRTDNTTYGVGNDSGRAVYGISDATTNNAGNLLAFVIVDDGGSDTVDYSAFSSDQLINLNQETFSNVGGSTGNMSIARGTVIENAVAGSGNDTLIGNDTGNVLTGGLGDDTIDGGSNVDVAVFSGNMADYTITQTALGVFVVEGADGTDTLTNVEFLQFDDQNMRLLRGTGVSVDFDTGDASDYQAAMDNILDFDGNALGGNGSWVHIGSIDINGDGDVDEILVNAAIGRFATVGFADDGLVYFDDHSWSGETRVVGIYIDPLVESGEVEAGSDLDSQRRFQNDLQIGNISTVLSADDFDGDGVWEVYFALTDGTAFLRALMHADGNIRYANYQSEAQVIEYLTANGYGEETYGDWFGDNAAQPGAEVITFVNEGITQKDDANGADASDASTTDIPDASGRVGPVSMAAIDAPLPGELTISDLIDLAQQMEGPDPIGPIDTLVPVLDPMHLEFFG